MARLFAITLFASAFLLFWVQPLVAKLLLPYLGGSPTVWNVAMCFFQAALLAGYAWAHWLGNRPSLKLQITVHASTLVLAALVLPFQLPAHAADQLAQGANPFSWLLLNLALLCGLPFLLLSANSPLLQRWFARTGHPRANDPYFLFAASNAGSLLALIAFPLLFEPTLRLAQQSNGWSVGYLLLAALVTGCGLQVLRHHSTNTFESASETCADTPHPARRAGEGCQHPPSPTSQPPALTFSKRFKWAGLSFIPSSLMLGVTQYLTTDVATLPLLWVLPLAIYLLTFVVAFGPGSFANRVWLSRLLPILAVAVLFTVVSGANDPIWVLFPLHLSLLLVAGLVCHGRLAANRPPVESLTEFYFWMSLGGVAGGVFNGLFAPMVFDRVAEYPLVIVTLALLAPLRVKVEETDVRRRASWLAALAAGLLLLGLLPFAPSLAGGKVQLANLFVFGLPCVVAFLVVDHPRRFALALLSILTAGWLAGDPRGQTLVRERNFFGVSRVTLSADGRFHELHHGSTIHGRQFVDERWRKQPLSYYHGTGPLRQIVAEFESRDTPRRVAVIGLGAGAMAAYAKPGQEWTFYEIDPIVIRLAQDTNYFTYLRDCQAAAFKIVPGDARLQLREAPDGHYGLIVLDAFSSDSVPVHLLTRVAMAVYLRKLAPNGLLGFHVSNRNLNVQAVVRSAALDAGLVCIERDEQAMGGIETYYGKDTAQWAMAAREAGGMRDLLRPGFWEERKPHPGLVWTDDYSSVWRVLRR